MAFGSPASLRWERTGLTLYVISTVRRAVRDSERHRKRRRAASEYTTFGRHRAVGEGEVRHSVE